jgi:hypothetical protein
MKEITVFYEINPSKDQKVCCHCKNWMGMLSCGECRLTNEEKMADDTCGEFGFDDNPEKGL